MIKILQDHPNLKEAVQVSPAATATASYYLFGVPLNQVLLIVTIVYTAVLLVEKVVKGVRWYLKRKDRNVEAVD